jgi:hypothetical protein
MWSENVNGRQGLVPESYHRLGVCVAAEDFLAEFHIHLRQLVTEGLLAHIMLRFDKSSKSVDVFAIIDKLKTIQSCVSNPIKKVFLTVTFEICGDERIRDVVSLIENECLDCLLIGYQSSSQETVESFLRMRSFVPNGIKIGLEGVPSDQLQWVMDRCGENAISVINPGKLCVPNISMRTIDFAHSRQCNVISVFSGDNDGNYDYLNSLRAKYNRTSETILVKVMLQLGLIVILDIRYGIPKLKSDFLQLCHPLTYRHPVLAPEILKAFIVEDADVHIVIAASEAMESVDDFAMLKFALRVPSKKVLSHQVVEDKR